MQAVASADVADKTVNPLAHEKDSAICGMPILGVARALD